MNRIIIVIAALVLSQASAAKENKTVAELFDNGGMAIIETCQEQGFDIVCTDLLFVLDKSIVRFCESLTNPGAEGLRKADLEKCFATSASEFYRYEAELRDEVEVQRRELKALIEAGK